MFNANDQIVLRLSEPYGGARNYQVKNECPKCKSKIIKTGTHSGCYDGDWDYTDKFTCENNCFITFSEIKKYNNIKN
jgi:hypothetical protein